ncbi:hypothetical protein SteCoe_14576 [Stentor coeruleus]|uniref:Uncharacterized protein n=1 Tax=Stentor coeruleus TaxID=5963 RepID=A0A1R2C5U2_9CILI|nr:hypothetical protein SteCoe_14576 [Stentor coeruleus]
MRTPKMPTKANASQIQAEENNESLLKDCETNMLKAISERLKLVFGQEIPSKDVNVLCKFLENICTGTCAIKVHDIECRVSDLLSLHEKLENIIRQAQDQKLFKAKLKLLNFRVNVKVMRNDETLSSKSEISQNLSRLGEEDNYVNKIQVLEEKIRDLEFKLQIAHMQEAFEDFPKIPETFELQVPEKFDVFCGPGPSSEFYSMRKYAVCQAKLLVEKEWECFDAKQAKIKYHKKLKKLSVKKAKLAEIEARQRKRTLELEKEKETLDRGKIWLESTKNKFNAQNNHKIAAIKTFLIEISSFLNFSFTSEENSMQKSNTSIDMINVDSEISQLERELKILESQFKSRNVLDKSNLERQMEHIKNRLTYLRGLKAMQCASKNNNTFSTASNTPFFERLSPVFTKKIAPNKREEVIIGKVIDEDTELRRQLRVKELRIKEREEEVLIHEERAMKYWERNLETKEIIKNAELAMSELKRMKDKYENRLEFFDKKKLELQEKLNEILRREGELFDMRKEFDLEKDKFEHEKQSFIGKVKTMQNILERN